MLHPTLLCFRLEVGSGKMPTRAAPVDGTSNSGRITDMKRTEPFAHCGALLLVLVLALSQPRYAATLKSQAN